MQRFIHTKQMKLYEMTKDIIDTYFDRLEEDFPSLESAHITLEHSNHAFKTDMHIHGKRLDLAASSEDSNIYKAIAEAFDRIHCRSRKCLDKRQHH